MAKHANPLSMALRSCVVSCRDIAGTEHSVEVTAESLYEAEAQALGILRGDIWVEKISEALTELKVRVKQPAVEHLVWMKDFRRWLESQGKTPAECTRKRKLMAVAKGGRAGAVIGAAFSPKQKTAAKRRVVDCLAGGISTERPREIGRRRRCPTTLKSNMETRLTPCRLCFQNSTLQNSHLLPGSAYKYLRIVGERCKSNPLFLSAKMLVQTSQQVSDFLLCSKCEDRFNNCGERWSLSHCDRGRGRFRLREILSSNAPR
jgi:hypothetical protein